jgi:trigger factor
MSNKAIEVEIEKPQEWGRILKIKVSPDRIEQERERVVQSVRKKAKIPGFRHGKAPANLVNQHYKSQIEGETLETVINSAVEETLEKEKLKPITKAAIDNLKYEDNQPLEFEARFEIQPEIDLERYSSFKLKMKKSKVDDDEIELFIQNLREQKVTYHEADIPAADGNLLTIDYTPLDKDEVILEKQKVEDIKVVLGKNQILPEIEAELYGKKAGHEEITLVQYPEDFHREELRGEKKSIKVFIKTVEEPRLPELDSEFIKSMGDFKDKKSFKKHIGDEILREKQKEADKKLEEELINNIIDANPFEVPETMVNLYLAGLVRNFQDPESSSEDLKEIDEKIRPIAEREVKKSLIIDFILKKEKLEPNAKEIEEEVEKLAGELKQQPDELKSSIMANPDDYNTIQQKVARKKVFDFLVSKSTIQKS